MGVPFNPSAGSILRSYETAFMLRRQNTLNLRLVVLFYSLLSLSYTTVPAHKERTFGESHYVIAMDTL